MCGNGDRKGLASQPVCGGPSLLEPSPSGCLPGIGVRGRLCAGITRGGGTPRPCPAPLGCWLRGNDASGAAPLGCWLRRGAPPGHSPSGFLLSQE